MRPLLIATLIALPLPAGAGANPDAVYRRLITGTWAVTAEACTTATAFTFAPGEVRRGPEVCQFNRPQTGRNGVGVALDLSCPLSGDASQMSQETLQMTLQQVDVGLPNPGDVLTLEDAGFPVRLRRCPVPAGQ